MQSWLFIQWCKICIALQGREAWGRAVVMPTLGGSTARQERVYHQCPTAHLSNSDLLPGAEHPFTLGEHLLGELHPKGTQLQLSNTALQHEPCFAKQTPGGTGDLLQTHGHAPCLARTARAHQWAPARLLVPPPPSLPQHWHVPKLWDSFFKNKVVSGEEREEMKSLSQSGLKIRQGAGRKILVPTKV